MNTLIDAANAVKTLSGFIGRQQLKAIDEGCRGEESQYFIDKLVEMAGVVSTMPMTYGQDGLGEQAVAHLHYFRGGMDWYITEKDMGAPCDHMEQRQAYGLADLGQGAECGYISIKELIEMNVELDLHFTPTTLVEIRSAA